MKNVMIVVVLFFAFLLTSCSELTQEQTLVSTELNSFSKPHLFNDQINQCNIFRSIPIKEWKESLTNEGIELVFSSDMRELDFVHVIIERSDLNESMLIFLQRVNGVVHLPFSLGEIKDIRAYGIYNSTADNGVYPFYYLQNFPNLKVESWENGGSVMKVAASEWNMGNKDLFAEIFSLSENLLVFVGNPQSNVFELPTFELKQIYGLNLFATIKNLDLPYDANL